MNFLLTQKASPNGIDQIDVDQIVVSSNWFHVVVPNKYTILVHTQFGQSAWVTCNLVNTNFSETLIICKLFNLHYFSPCREVVVAQLVEQSLSIPEVRGSTPVIGKILLNICLLSAVLKRQK